MNQGEKNKLLNTIKILFPSPYKQTNIIFKILSGFYLKILRSNIQVRQNTSPVP